jgi:hypothetical protein
VSHTPLAPLSMLTQSKLLMWMFMLHPRWQSESCVTVPQRLFVDTKI